MNASLEPIPVTLKPSVVPANAPALDIAAREGLVVREGVLEVPGDVLLHHGGRLAGVRIAWRLVGPATAPVVCALGGISANRRVCLTDDPRQGWWSEIVGPDCALDVNRYRILSFDYLGGSGESTGPLGTGAGASGAGLSGPGASGPGVSGPGASGPGVSGPGTSGPGVSGPGTSGAGVSGPGASGAGASGPGASGAGASAPGVSGPGASDGVGANSAAGGCTRNPGEDGCNISPTGHGLTGSAASLGAVGSIGALTPFPANPFPSVSSYDQAEALVRILNHLGIKSLRAIAGGSYGGMVALAFGERYPERVGHLIVICAADRPHPMATAWRSVQRHVVRFAAECGRAKEGLQLARALAMSTYRSSEEFAARFSSAASLDGQQFVFPVERYLFARGSDYAARYRPEAFVCLSESIDLHRVEAARIFVPTTAVAIREDQLVPLADMRGLVARLPVGRLHEISSIYGHDAFLKESDQLRGIFGSALGSVA